MEGKEITHLVWLKKTGDQITIVSEVPAENNLGAIKKTKEMLKEKGFSENIIENGFKIKVINTYHKEKN